MNNLEMLKRAELRMHIEDAIIRGIRGNSDLVGTVDILELKPKIDALIDVIIANLLEPAEVQNA